jgi:hypothetical protein
LRELATHTRGFQVNKGINKTHEELLSSFPPGKLHNGQETEFDKPHVFVDVDGLIGAIYLPGVYHPMFTVSFVL